MRLALLLALALGSLTPALAADPNSPHPHQGALKPYPTPPRPVTLSAAQEAQVRAGQPVYTQTDSGSQGRGVAVFAVNAPPSKVWGVIRSFSSYPKWISGVKTCEVYRTSGDHQYVRFVVSKMGVSFEYYIDHNYPSGAEWGTWRLDYSRESDLDDSVGMWRVTPLEGDASRSRVEYSVDVKISSWLPDFARDMLVDQGLKDATTWVKAQAEK